MKSWYYLKECWYQVTYHDLINCKQKAKSKRNMKGFSKLCLNLRRC